MFRVKLGLHIFVKNLFLNILLLAQLFVVISSINSVILFSDATQSKSTIMKNLSKEQLIFYANVFGNDYDYIFEGLSGQPYAIEEYTYSQVGVTNALIKGYDIDLLDKLNYKPKKGRWFDLEDKGKKHVVLSNNGIYKVGDSVFVDTANGRTAFEVIGILDKNERILNMGGMSPTWEFMLPATESDDENIICITDLEYEFLKNKRNKSSNFFIGFKEKITSEQLQSNIDKLKFSSRSVNSVQDLQQNTVAEEKLVFRIMIPIIVFISIIAFFGFMFICTVNIKNCDKEFKILNALGAESKDFVAIMAFIVGLPILVNAVLFIIFSKIQIVPLALGAVRVSWKNFVVAFSVLALFGITNYAFLHRKFFRKGGMLNS